MPGESALKSLTLLGTKVRETGLFGGRLIAQLSKTLRVTLAVLLTFGISAVGNAAQKIKKRVRNAKSTLKSSYSAHMMAKAWNYFHPSWEVTSEETTASAIAQQVTSVLQDPDSKIDKDFRVPSRLKGRVRFWVEVYARYNSQYRIVHDRENPDLIYGVIDLRPLYRAFPTGVAQAKSYQIEKMVLKTLKAKIAEAGEISRPRTSNLTPQEKEGLKHILSQFGADNREEVEELVRKVRTQTGQQDHFLQALNRSRKMLPQIEQIFRDKGLPIALTRLPFVETSFNPRAVSKTGALGMWQFMPDTARLFDPRGSRKDWADPIRQSKNAARMLNILHDKLSNWGIAVTGYNSGGARLARIVEKHGAATVEDLLKIPASKDTLGFAGRNFFCELVAANLVVTYQDKLFSPRALHLSRSSLSRRVQSLIETTFVANDIKPAPASDEVRIKRDIDSKKVKKHHGKHGRKGKSKTLARVRHSKKRGRGTISKKTVARVRVHRTRRNTVRRTMVAAKAGASANHAAR